MGGSKRVTFTVNNPQAGNIHALEELFKHPDVEWATFQYEMGASGTVHLQGAITFRYRKHLGTVCRLLQGVEWGCGCIKHPISLDSDDEGAGTATTIEITPSPEPEDQAVV